MTKASNVPGAVKVKSPSLREIKKALSDKEAELDKLTDKEAISLKEEEISAEYAAVPGWKLLIIRIFL